MLKFNNTHIFTGYLKQLLGSFKLPTYRIYSSKNEQFAKSNNLETDIIPSTVSRFVPYLKTGKLQIYSNKASAEEPNYGWSQVAASFRHNKNNYKSLVISNNIYDSYTHKYLGEFLRYQRDANDLDLMCLYNCFSDEMPALLSYIYTKPSENFSTKFDTSDSKYKIYMVPVKYLQEYTIAIDCNSRVEMFCGFYNKYFIKGNDDTIASLNTFMNKTYVSYSSIRFNDPIIYDKLMGQNIWNDLLASNTKFNFDNHEEDLKLFIKLPSNNNSSIVILEGNYVRWNDRQYKIDHASWNGKAWDVKNNWKQISNKFIVNFENYEERLLNNEVIFKPITNLQLLQLNTGTSYPFADRLIEYLIGNAITGEDELEDNVKRIQSIMHKNDASYTATSDFYGLWDEYIRPVLYCYMQGYVTNSSENHDLLGYVDKDTENNYKSVNNAQHKVIDTLKDIDLYDDIYLAAKAKEIKRGY